MLFGSHWLGWSQAVWLLIFFKLSYFVFSRRKKVIQVWNDMRVSRSLILCGTIPLYELCLSVLSKRWRHCASSPLLSKVSFSLPQAMTVHAEKASHSFCHLGTLLLPHPLCLCWGQCNDSASWHFSHCSLNRATGYDCTALSDTLPVFLHLHCKTKVQLLSKEDINTEVIPLLRHFIYLALLDKHSRMWHY